MNIAQLFLVFLFSLLCQGHDTPIVGVGLHLDVGALGLEDQGIIATPISGSIASADAFTFSIDKRSQLSYGSQKLHSAHILFNGGIQWSKGNQKIPMTSLLLDLRTGDIRAKTGGAMHHAFGSVDVSSVELTKEKGSTVVQASITSPVTVDESFVATINKHLATNLEEPSMEAELSFNVDLVTGNTLNKSLVLALRLDREIDLNMDVAGLMGTTFDTSVDLG